MPHVHRIVLKQPPIQVPPMTKQRQNRDPIDLHLAVDVRRREDSDAMPYSRESSRELEGVSLDPADIGRELRSNQPDGECPCWSFVQSVTQPLQFEDALSTAMTRKRRPSATDLPQPCGKAGSREPAKL